MSILIIESNKKDREQLKFLLNLGGYFDIVFKKNSDDALDALNIDGSISDDQNYDLIIMDLFMEGIDGIDVCKKIKSTDFFRDIPLIVITNEENIEEMFKAFEIGALDYITKPLANKFDLLPRVNSALNLKLEMATRKKREKELLKLTRLLKDSYKN